VPTWVVLTVLAATVAASRHAGARLDTLVRVLTAIVTALPARHGDRLRRGRGRDVAGRALSVPWAERGPGADGPVRVERATTRRDAAHSSSATLPVPSGVLA